MFWDVFKHKEEEENYKPLKVFFCINIILNIKY